MKSRCDELRRARPLLGTIVEIVVRSSRTSSSAEAIEPAFAAIATVQHRMSFHDSGSVLSRLNAHAFDRPVPVDEKTLQVLKTARDLHLLSGGLFDPTIAPYLEREGFLPERSGKEIEKGFSFADVEFLSGNCIRFRRAGVRLDLGGVAKGFAVDEAIIVLRAAGIESALVNAGGDLRAFGPHSFGVEIRDPLHPGRMLVRLLVHDRAVATSAHYFADRLRPENRIGPFVNPRLGSLHSALLSVTIAASTAMVADALTKIVMLDPANSLALLERFSAAALVVDPHGCLLCTPNWHETIQAAA